MVEAKFDDDLFLPQFFIGFLLAREQPFLKKFFGKFLGISK